MVNIKKNIQDSFLGTISHNDLKDSNIVYTCPKHGKDTYFQIKPELCRYREDVGKDYKWLTDQGTRSSRQPT